MICLDHNQPFLYWQYIDILSKNQKIKKNKIKNGDFGVFQSLEVRRKFFLILKSPDFYMWFALCNEIYRKMIKDFVFYFFWFCSHIWLNLPKGGRLLFFFFLFSFFQFFNWMIADFSYKQKFLEQNTEDSSSPRWCTIKKKKRTTKKTQQQQHHHAYNLQVGYCHSIILSFWKFFLFIIGASKFWHTLGYFVQYLLHTPSSIQTINLSMSHWH